MKSMFRLFIKWQSGFQTRSVIVPEAGHNVHMQNSWGIYRVDTQRDIYVAPTQATSDINIAAH